MREREKERESFNVGLFMLTCSILREAILSTDITTHCRRHAFSTPNHPVISSHSRSN